MCPHPFFSSNLLLAQQLCVQMSHSYSWKKLTSILMCTNLLDTATSFLPNVKTDRQRLRGVSLVQQRQPLNTMPNWLFAKAFQDTLCPADAHEETLPEISITYISTLIPTNFPLGLEKRIAQSPQMLWYMIYYIIWVTRSHTTI